MLGVAGTAGEEGGPHHVPCLVGLYISVWHKTGEGGIGNVGACTHQRNVMPVDLQIVYDVLNNNSIYAR